MITKIKNLYNKYKEIVLYFIFGGLTTVLSIATFELCFSLMNLGTTISNVISWLLAVTFAFFTNRTFIFKTNDTLIKEASKFIAGRIFTLILETVLLILMIDALTFNSAVSKIIAQVVVFVSNYLISKFIVFKNKEKSTKSGC